MSELNHCPKCGAELPPGAAETGRDRTDMRSVVSIREVVPRNRVQ
jgi:hypothetical protein